MTAKSLPLVDNYFKSSALRGPSAPQANFASEQLIDDSDIRVTQGVRIGKRQALSLARLELEHATAVRAPQHL